MNRLFSNGPCAGPSGAPDKNKDWQLELLMEKLRSKSTQMKNFADTSKAIRMTLLDKRYALDSVEKALHQKCLDTLQHSMKVTSLQSMVERLESLTRQLGLKFAQAPSGVELFISSDMFYLEIVLDQTGAVCDVKVHHEGTVEQKSCEELVASLSKNDLIDFTAQLEGFASIYQLNAEKKVKARAFTALQSLEADLNTLAQLQTFIKEPFNVLHKSPVGVLEKRRGGHAMRLTYFVSPYDLIDAEAGVIEPISVDAILGRRLGYSVTVHMEGSTAHKLQTATLINVNRSHNGKSTPSYASLTALNSALVPACFVLMLNEPMPMCVGLLRQIHAITELGGPDCASAHPLLSLIAKHSSDGQLDSSHNRGLFVTLPDQSHCYFMTESCSMQGVLVSSIPFTHPAHVAQILVVLRQQALFNTLIASCIRLNSTQDFENMVMLEVSALSWTHISVSLEHPIEESMSTAEIDLSDISNLACRIFSPGSPPPHSAPDVASDLSTKVLNRSFSIPITMRSILHHWEKQQQVVRHQNHFNGLENFNLPLGAGDPGGRNGNSGNTLGERETTSEPSLHGMPLMSHPHQGMFLNESLMGGASFAGFQPDGATVTPVLTNVELTNILAGGDKPRQRAKRKAPDDVWKGSGAKRKPAAADDDLLDASSSDSTSRSTPLSQDVEIATPNVMLGFHSDLELGALNASELIGDNEADFDADVEELLAGKNDASPTRMLPDFQSNKLVSPSVSITPIHMAGAASGGTTSPIIVTPPDQARTGIEIFPITTASAQLSGSVTITPIVPKSDKDRKDKSGKRSDDRPRIEKKKRRKREGSPMGPPEKIPSKADALLLKPAAAGGGGGAKPLESPPNSPNMARKFSQSPTQNRSLSGKLSPNPIKSTIKTHSPKHSPAHMSSSPKHVLPGIGSPKSSPKHPSTSGSGKPSMSTLKNAASSPSSKSDAKKSGSKDSAREKDKKAGGGYVNATKSGSKGTVKVKPLDLNTHSIEMPSGGPESGGTTSPGLGTDLSKTSGGLNQMRNRKSGNLSAIVDKLAKAQNCDMAADAAGKQKERVTTPGKSENHPAAPPKGVSASKLAQDAKNSEYVLLKHSSDCMKLTINKTRAREPSAKPMKTCGSSTGSNNTGMTSAGMSGTGSPKNHTGLKPGVNSGPASKKPQQPGSAKPPSSNPNAGHTLGSLKPFKTSSSTILSSSSSSSIKPANASSSSPNSLNPKKILNFYPPKNSFNDTNRLKDRPKINKSFSEKSIFGKTDKGKASPPTQDAESLTLNFPSKKQFDKSFQIPKLSARAGDDKKSKPVENNVLSVSKDKLLDIFGANSGIIGTASVPGKYPLSLPTSKLFDGNMEAKIRSTMNNVAIPSSLSISATTSTSPKREEEEKKGKDDAFGKLFPISAGSAASNMQYAPASVGPLGLAGRSIDLTSKFVAPAPKLEEKKQEKKDKDELEFAMAASIGSPGVVSTAGGSAEKKRVVEMPLPFPPSPSVSVHIVKSPAPSPHIAPSPHAAASPSITDDELMDEALVGLGK